MRQQRNEDYEKYVEERDEAHRKELEGIQDMQRELMEAVNNISRANVAPRPQIIQVNPPNAGRGPNLAPTINQPASHYPIHEPTPRNPAQPPPPPPPATAPPLPFPSPGRSSSSSGASSSSEPEDPPLASSNRYPAYPPHHPYPAYPPQPYPGYPGTYPPYPPPGTYPPPPGAYTAPPPPQQPIQPFMGGNIPGNFAGPLLGQDSNRTSRSSKYPTDRKDKVKGDDGDDGSEAETDKKNKGKKEKKKGKEEKTEKSSEEEKDDSSPDSEEEPSQKTAPKNAKSKTSKTSDPKTSKVSESKIAKPKVSEKSNKSGKGKEEAKRIISSDEEKNSVAPIPEKVIKPKPVNSENSRMSKNSKASMTNKDVAKLPIPSTNRSLPLEQDQLQPKPLDSKKEEIAICVYRGKLFPDCVSISKIVAIVFDEKGNKLAESVEKVAELDSDIFNPIYNARFKVSQEILNPKTRAFLYIIFMTIDEVMLTNSQSKVLCGSILAVSVIPLFVDKKTLQPATEATNDPLLHIGNYTAPLIFAQMASLYTPEDLLKLVLEYQKYNLGKRLAVYHAALLMYVSRSCFEQQAVAWISMHYSIDTSSLHLKSSL